MAGLSSDIVDSLAPVLAAEVGVRRDSDSRPRVIIVAIQWHLRFNLSYHDGEELRAFELGCYFSLNASSVRELFEAIRWNAS
jgi:hypothetical protein